MKSQKEFTIEIIAVGSELLTPYFWETNSLYLTERLDDLGLEVSFRNIVGDDWDDLLSAIKTALSRSHLVIATGGLGPTQDDKTRQALAKALNRKLIFHPEILDKIKKRFQFRGLSMPAVNKKQAYVIEGAEPLDNKNGTAPGTWLEMEKQKILLLPGPPHELKPMFDESVWPRLKKLRKSQASRKVLKVASLTESQIESVIADLYPKTSRVKISTLPYPGQIEIHLVAYSNKSRDQAESLIRKLEKRIFERLKDHIFSFDGEELEEVVGKLLKSQKKTLAVAESCTGGLLSNRITNVPGSSDYFLQGTVAYSNQAKIGFLGIRPAVLQKHGAVSPQTAKAMAKGIKEKAQADYGLGITGIAGPSGGTPQKPVGLVYISLSWEGGTKVSKNIFTGNRKTIKYQSSQKAMDMLRRHLQEAKT